MFEEQQKTTAVASKACFERRVAQESLILRVDLLAVLSRLVEQGVAGAEKELVVDATEELAVEAEGRAGQVVERQEFCSGAEPKRLGQELEQTLEQGFEGWLGQLQALNHDEQS